MNVHVIKTVPITFKMVVDAYGKVKKGGKAAGIDGESWETFDKDAQGNLYVIWNRLSIRGISPTGVKGTEIPNKDGAKRKLGISNPRAKRGPWATKDLKE